VNSPDVVGVEFEPNVLQREGTVGSLIVRAKHPQRFFQEIGRLVVAEEIHVARLEALDDSAHAILGYLLGGCGKT
jgi:ABC-2 type transport system ATP-binding protein